MLKSPSMIFSFDEDMCDNIPILQQNKTSSRKRAFDGVFNPQKRLNNSDEIYKEPYELLWQKAEEHCEHKKFNKAFHLYQRILSNQLYPENYRIAAQRSILGLYAYGHIPLPLLSDTYHLIMAALHCSAIDIGDISPDIFNDEVLILALQIELYLQCPALFANDIFDVQEAIQNFRRAAENNFSDENAVCYTYHLNYIQELKAAE